MPDMADRDTGALSIARSRLGAMLVRQVMMPDGLKGHVCRPAVWGAVPIALLLAACSGGPAITSGLSIMPAAEALESASESRTGLEAAIEAAGRAVVETKDLQSRRGRASWLQERSIGLQDPGATAFLRFLESWHAASTVTTPTS